MMLAFSNPLTIGIFTFVAGEREFDDHVFSSGDFEADEMHTKM